MRLRLAALAVAVLLGTASASYAQYFLSTGPLPIYGARFSYGGPLLGAPLYGADAYGGYGYGYGNYGATYGTYGANYGTYGYGYGAAVPAYRYGLFGRRTSLRRTLWIFGPQTNTTDTTRNPTTFDASTIKVTPVSDGRDFSKQLAEARSWQYLLQGKTPPRTVSIYIVTEVDPGKIAAKTILSIMESSELKSYCKDKGFTGPRQWKPGNDNFEQFKKDAESDGVALPALLIRVDGKSKAVKLPSSGVEVIDAIKKVVD